MNLIKLPTKYAPAERQSDDEIKRQIKIFEKDKLLSMILPTMPSIFVIVNNLRQVVYMNKIALKFAGLESLTHYIGKRPGEIFGCIHSKEEEGGCGTSESCTYCGAVNAVLTSQKGKAVMEEGRLILGPNQDTYDLRIWATPLKIESEEFTVITLEDIQHEKRRLVLERIFFHDIMNTINQLYLSLQLAIENREELKQGEYVEDAIEITNTLIEEIHSQQILSAAENNVYNLKVTTLNSLKLLNQIVNNYKSNEIAREKRININDRSESLEVWSDRALLLRVIGNMVKNALEAITKRETVTIGCNRREKNVEFWVHNPGIIPRNIQLQIFKRSFSTKGANRGLGTYSMKLLSSLLSGEVSFSTSEEKGTIFKVIIPIKFRD